MPNDFSSAPVVEDVTDPSTDTFTVPDYLAHLADEPPPRVVEYARPAGAVPVPTWAPSAPLYLGPRRVGTSRSGFPRYGLALLRHPDKPHAKGESWRQDRRGYPRCVAYTTGSSDDFPAWMKRATGFVAAMGGADVDTLGLVACWYRAHRSGTYPLAAFNRAEDSTAGPQYGGAA